MYHYISQAPAAADVYRRDLSVTPQRFTQQMQYLKQAGYTMPDWDPAQWLGCGGCHADVEEQSEGPAEPKS